MKWKVVVTGIAMAAGPLTAWAAGPSDGFSRLRSIADLMRLILVPLLCLSVAARAWETLDTSFSTAKEAVDAGMVEKGWIPDWLPQDATGLREVHDVDSNASELSFASPTFSQIHLPSDCRPIAYKDTVPARIGRDWWPAEDVLGRSYTFFRCQADHTEYRFVGISRAEGRALHWRTYTR
ncbi:MAG TPA: hypothetical protein VIT90_05095 [Lysobacter sp.]